MKRLKTLLLMLGAVLCVTGCSQVNENVEISEDAVYISPSTPAETGNYPLSLLDENEATLMANMKKVAGNEIKLNKMLDELFSYDQQVCKYYNITNEYQEKLAQRILGGKEQ